MSQRLLIADDEQGVRAALGQLLEYEGHEVRAVASGTEALKAYESWRPHLVFLDVKMSGIDGLETLKRLRAHDPAALVIMISGHGTIQTAVEATQLGAYDFLEKPLDTDRILVTLRNALRHAKLQDENVRLREKIESRHEIVGKSAAIRGLIERLERVGPTNARVLITGENGTGKELVARAIHAVVGAARWTVRGGELRRDPVGAHRERTVRASQGIVHRRDRRSRREVRAGDRAACCSWTKSAT